MQREKAGEYRCENCGSFGVEERVFVNMSMPQKYNFGLALSLPATENGTTQVYMHPIEGAEFLCCRVCGWQLVTTYKTLDAIAKLQDGEVVLDYKEGGNSMEPLISSMDPVHLMPVDPTKLEKGDIVLVRVRGKIFTHLVTALQVNQVQISNNHGKVNGWTPLKNVYGIVTHVKGNLKTKALRKVPQDVLDNLPKELLK